MQGTELITVDKKEKKIKGIILVAGEGTRALPSLVAKPFLNVFDKPMVYYSIAALMEAGIKDILIITSPRELDNTKRLSEMAKLWGINLSYEVQEVASGIPDAFNIGAKFIGDDNVCLVLGDNIFIGEQFQKALSSIPATFKSGALNFCLEVKDPERFGVFGFDAKNNVTALVEKPKRELAPSNFASIGLYVFDSRAVKFTQGLKPSARDETEITDVMKKYIESGEFQVIKLDSSVQWHDAGNAKATLAAAIDIQDHAEKGELVGSPEIAALKKGWISPKDLIAHYEKNDKYFKSAYYLAIKKFAQTMQAKNEKTLTAFSLFSSASASAPSSPIPGSQTTTPPPITLSPNM